MSPEAVTRRLQLMDELWELSVKLMNSTKAAVAERSFQYPWVAGDGAPLIVMEEMLLDCWEGSDAPSGGRIVEAQSRWGLDVATDYDLACDVREIAGVIDMSRGKAFVLSTNGDCMATWLPGFVGFAGALVEWDYADAEDELVEESKALIHLGEFSQAVEFSVNSSPLVLFVAAERGHEDAYARQVFDLAPGCYRVRSGRRVTDKTAVVCHLFELKAESI